MKPVFAKLRALVALGILSAGAAKAALITLRTDTDNATVQLDGVVSPGEYGPGNTYAYSGGGTGFQGRLGNATLLANSDAGTLYFALTNAGVHNNGDRFLMYFHTRPGGFQPDGLQMNDGVALNTNILSRRQASLLTTGGLERVTFNEGGVTNNPDFAFIMNNRAPGAGAFSFLYSLAPTGSAHGLVTHSVTGFGTSTIEIAIPRSALGVGSGGAVDVVALQISDTSFLSNEGIPATGISSNPGFAFGQTNVFADFHRFVASSFDPPGTMTQRIANTTLRMPSSPPAALTNAYATEPAFPGVAFTNPIHVINPPGETNRLFILERAGRIIAITNLAAPTRHVFMDISARIDVAGEGGLLGMDFHPGYATNRRFYVFYTARTTYQNRVSMFLINPSDPNLGDPASEQVVFSQLDEAANHNAGDIHFGPDGYLYVATGDEGGSDDSLNNAQIVDRDFFCALLRLDVDKRPGSLPPNPHPAINGPTTNYAIPPDNPLVGVTNYYGSNLVVNAVRTEFFATGLRNPFRFSFDPLTGEIYLADVGQNKFEEVNLVTNGGNYGWAAWEGFVQGPKTNARPASDYARPLLTYARGGATNQGVSVTGGVKYYGDRFPELVDHYIFSDYISGHIWGMTDNGVTNTGFKWLTTDSNISGFGYDPRNGDILLADLAASQVMRLVRATAGSGSLPPTLADAGVFRNLETLTPEPGIEPYDINVPFWSDNGIKRRWFSVPSTNLFVGFAPTGPWATPTGMVWIKHFDIELTNGVPASRRRLETRLLVRNASGDGGYGVTYRWGTSTTNATLVPIEGLDEPLVINDAGVIRTQVWRYPSRAECLVCHQSGAGFALSFNTVQMNRDFTHLVSPTNQLKALERAGYFSNAVGSVHGLLRVVAATNTEASLESRTRSYVHVNCANCHFPGGSAPGNFDARFWTPLESAGWIDGNLNNNGGNPANRIIVRGSVTNSMLHTRIAGRGQGQMPPVGSNLVDTQNVALVRDWINSIAGYQTFAEWQVANFGSTNNPSAPGSADPDFDGSVNRLEYLTGTSPTNAAEAWGLEIVTTNGAPAARFVRSPNTIIQVESTTNLAGGVWTPIDSPANAPFAAATASPVVLPDPALTNAPEAHFRARVRAP